MAYGILVPPPGIKPAPLALDALNHWSAREIPLFLILWYYFLSVILKSLICIYILYAAPFPSCCKYYILECPCLTASVIVIIIITSFLQLLLITTWLKGIECLPWRKAWQPTPVFLSGESHGQRKLAGYSPRGRKELDTAEQLMHTHPLCQVYLRTVGHYLIYFSQQP